MDGIAEMHPDFICDRTIRLLHMVEVERGGGMLPTAGELQAMRDADIRQADKKTLKDIGEIQIDQSKSIEERARSYLEQVQNPFLVKSGDYILKIQYADSDKTMTDCIMEYISNMIRLREL